MLNTLRFNLTVPTPYVFMVRFLKAASSDKQTELLAFFFVELCLTEYVAVKYSPSILAASAVYTAHQTLQKSPCWTPTLSRHSGYGELQLRLVTHLLAIRTFLTVLYISSEASLLTASAHLFSYSVPSRNLCFRDCARMMVGLHQKSAESKLVVVHKKYSSSKLQSVAALAPANPILWDSEDDRGSVVGSSK